MGGRAARERRLARAFPEIRLIIGAHDEAELPVRIGQTTIVSAGKYGKYAATRSATDMGTPPARLVDLMD